MYIIIPKFCNTKCNIKYVVHENSSESIAVSHIISETRRNADRGSAPKHKTKINLPKQQLISMKYTIYIYGEEWRAGVLMVYIQIVSNEELLDKIKPHRIVYIHICKAY